MCVEEGEGFKLVAGGEEAGGLLEEAGGGLQMRRSVCGRTWLHVVPAAGLAATARRPTLTRVVGLLAGTVHVLLHTLYPLGRAGHTQKEGGTVYSVIRTLHPLLFITYIGVIRKTISGKHDVHFEV